MNINLISHKMSELQPYFYRPYIPLFFTPPITENKYMNELRLEIQNAINRNSAENGSDTPDWLLAQYLIDCLDAYDRTVVAREKWYGRPCGRSSESFSAVPTNTVDNIAIP